LQYYNKVTGGSFSLSRFLSGALTMIKAPSYMKAGVVVVGLMISSVASATTGYFTLGYGAKSMGLAGAVVSNPQDAIAAAANPAGMGLVGKRWDVGMRFFSPIREAELSTSAYGATYDVQDRSRRDLFMIPNFGYTSQIREDLWWGISLYGNGGMNTTYDRNLFDETAAFLGAIGTGTDPGDVPEGAATPFADTGTLGVDLSQALLAPTIAMKLKNGHTVGASLLMSVQRFSARGLGNFQCFTGSVATNPANAGTCPSGYAAVPSSKLTNQGSDWSYGAGVRVGWIGEVSPRVTLGASAASKIKMTELDKYEELFAEQGSFDIPANFALGVTFKATPKLDVSLEFQRILYEGINSVSNAGPVPTAGGPSIGAGSGTLGADNGLGFGWEDINIYRIAGEYQYNNQWTLRAGFAANDQPIAADQLLFNILAPAVIQRHATVGFTYSPDSSTEWNFAYMRAFREKVEATSSFVTGMPGSIEMYQNSVDFSYSRKF